VQVKRVLLGAFGTHPSHGLSQQLLSIFFFKYILIFKNLKIKHIKMLTGFTKIATKTIQAITAKFRSL
jgi:hypothetical protein